MKANLPAREPEFIKKWESENTYKELRDKNKGKKQFILHDGPPYANGHIHIGTSLNEILKDLIVKYKSMTGHYSPYTPGWDCHGLPIEQQCMKDMKVDKHKVNLVEFRKAAAAFAKKFVDIQRDEFKRLGVLSDWERPYLTLDPKYEAVIIKVFGGLVKNGYIYRQKKPVYWCPTCETALADAEVEYADHISHSIFVKFKVIEATAPMHLSLTDSPSVLIWTTTPWTLPANVALAFHPEAEYAYAALKLKDGSTENLILSKKLLPAVAERIGAVEYKIKQEFAGDKLEGMKTLNPLMQRQSVGILAGFVTLEDGTGVVHIAPGHGQDDYAAGLKYKLPIISPVDDKGIFTEEVDDFKGHKVFAANPLIVEKLKSLGVLLLDEKLTHPYPHCWRCKRAIIFRATPQWFMSVEHEGLRKKMLDIIKTVKWIPPYSENRIAGMIETRPDWCLSRQRLWGVPIPVFYCEKCGEPLLDEKIINHIAGKVAENGADVWYEKSAEELLNPLDVECGKCKHEKFRKEQDILDVWFDSGVSHEAVLASGDYKDLTWPADLYSEGSDQHRGWFQTSLLSSAALRGKAPYKNVLTHGFVVDGEGKKMSKSLGNVIASDNLIKQYGADIMRLWVATSDYKEDIRISPEILKGLADAYRKIRNTLRFLLGNISDFDPAKDAVEYSKMREIDRHALSRLHELTSEITRAYETYEFHSAAIGINKFCTVDLSGFYLDALKDTLYCDGKDWPARRSAQTALCEICSALIRMTAPVLSFTCEEAWAELRKKDAKLPASVFLADFPVSDAKKIFAGELREKWEKLSQIRDKALMQFEELRKNKEIGSNLEAHAAVSCEEKDIDLLSNVLGTWDIEIKSSAEVSVTAKKSALKKCDRCWRHVADVGSDGLCPRCKKAI
ncbi:MAG: isoleucine--tRNA ligase [Elusimicrobiota bacterium]